MGKLNRTSKATEVRVNKENITKLIEDMLVNGTNGDRRKWKEAFKTLIKDKKLMTKIMEIDKNKAFEKYYELGEKRTLTSLSKETGFEVNRLSRWSRQDNWMQKVSERDRLVSDVLKAKAVLSITEIKLEYSSTIHRLIQEMVDNMDVYNRKVAEINAKIKNPKDLLKYKSLVYSSEDFERLVKLDLLMRGDVTDRRELSVVDRERIVEDQIANDEETRNLLKGLYNRTRAYSSGIKKLGSGSNGNGSGGRVIDITEEGQYESKDKSI